MAIVESLQAELEVASFGGKAVNLSRMVKIGLPVPSGIAISIDGFRDGKLTPDAQIDVTKFLEKNKLYAVRSSGLNEDSEGASWAGQFETYLNTRSDEVITKIEECHNSAKARAKAYARDKDDTFKVAVVVQEMLKPEYAGVLFTKNPVTGDSAFITEYVEGLGESLVGGQADPRRIVINDKTKALFDAQQLRDLASKVETLFGMPQDIEWASVQGEIWLLQARPITATNERRQGFYLEAPEELFYWGPSRAQPKYMDDFMAGVERLFKEMSSSPNMPKPPKQLALFHEGKMVWLSNSKDYFSWCEKTFEAYKIANRLVQDISNWQLAREQLTNLSGQEFINRLVDAWYFTEMAEFSLYGAEAFITKLLKRFDEQTLPKIWGAFSISDKPTFLNKLDTELAEIRNPVAMANKYPWIRDGYGGPNDEALWYFQQRLKAIQENGLFIQEDNEPKRQIMIKEYDLTDSEVSALTLARRLAEFMDDRKEWMMQTRRLIKDRITNIENGWYFDNGQVTLLDQINTKELWERYIDFKSSAGVVSGLVANTGGRHFVNGEVVVLNSHVDPAEDDKILVVPSTSPGWVPLMRHARALVSDHGGMMSHAAIVAREFNLPCIVGTKQGTKVLKTGDKIILDLVKGEIIK